jgi:hypothetical protein
MTATPTTLAERMAPLSDGRTLDRLTMLAGTIVRRTGTALEAHDAAMDALLTMAGREDGAGLLASLAMDEPAARLAFVRALRTTARNTKRADVRRAARDAAYAADGRWQSPTADGARSHAYYATAFDALASGQTTAQANKTVRQGMRSMERIGERDYGFAGVMTKKDGGAAILREQTTETMLAPMNLAWYERREAKRERAYDAMDVGASGTVLADRGSAAVWHADWSVRLTTLALADKGRGAAIMRTAVLALAQRTAPETAALARSWRTDATALPATAPVRESAEIRASMAERLALALAKRTLGAIAGALWGVPTRPSLALADVVMAALTVTSDSKRQRKAARTDGGRSMVDTGAVLAFLGLPEATNGAAAMRLRAVLVEAADTADATGVTVRPSGRLARYVADGARLQRQTAEVLAYVRSAERPTAAPVRQTAALADGWRPSQMTAAQVRGAVTLLLQGPAETAQETKVRGAVTLLLQGPAETAPVAAAPSYRPTCICGTWAKVTDGARPCCGAVVLAR